MYHGAFQEWIFRHLVCPSSCVLSSDQNTTTSRGFPTDLFKTVQQLHAERMSDLLDRGSRDGAT